MIRQVMSHMSHFSLDLIFISHSSFDLTPKQVALWNSGNSTGRCSRRVVKRRSTHDRARNGLRLLKLWKTRRHVTRDIAFGVSPRVAKHVSDKQPVPRVEETRNVFVVSQIHLRVSRSSERHFYHVGLRSETGWWCRRVWSRCSTHDHAQIVLNQNLIWTTFHKHAVNLAVRSSDLGKWAAGTPT